MSRQSKHDDHSKPSIEALSDAAKLYLQPLERLLALSPDLDEVLRGSAWKSAAIHVDGMLREEKGHLILIDRAVQNFIDCQGGQRAIVAQAKRDAQIETIDADELVQAHFKESITQLAFIALERHRVYGIDVEHLRLSEEEKRVLEDSCTTVRDRSVPSETHASTLATTLPSPISVMKGLLAEPRPDVIALQRELGRVASEILDRTVDLEQHRANDIGRIRIRTARALESKRAKLVHQASSGIMRGLGGKSRLALEAKLQWSKEASTPADSPIRGIAERVVKDMEVGIIGNRIENK